MWYAAQILPPFFPLPHPLGPKLSLPCCWRYWRLATPSCSLHPMTVLLRFGRPPFPAPIWENAMEPSSPRAPCAISQHLCRKLLGSSPLPVFSPAFSTPLQLSILRAHHNRFSGWNFPFQSLFQGNWGGPSTVCGHCTSICSPKSLAMRFSGNYWHLYFEEEKNFVKNFYVFCAESHYYWISAKYKSRCVWL